MNEIKDLVSLEPLKRTLAERGLKVKWLAEKAGILPAQLTNITRGVAFPKTDLLAKFAWLLRVPVSEVIEFKGIEPNANQEEWLNSHERKYEPSDNATGEPTYKPLWELIDGYLERANEGKTEGLKTANDLLDSIEPYGRTQGFGKGLTDEARELAMRSRGFSGDYVPRQKRIYKAKGLTPETRTKLRKDRPLSVRMIYDICKKLGCGIDWVLSYK